MKIKKRNIQIAFIICSVSLGIYTIFQFVSAKSLLIIGNKIEDIFNIRTNIMVEIVQSYVITLSSGIFISTLVALFFYIQEYKREKELLFRRVIDLNHRLCSVYKQIPYIEYADDGKLNKLIRKYYLEYYNNQMWKEIAEEGEKRIKKMPKRVRRQIRAKAKKALPEMDNTSQKELINFLKSNPTLCQTDINKVQLSPEEKLKNYIENMDYKLEKAKKVYEDILQLEIEELRNLAEDIETLKTYSKKKRQLLKMIMLDNDIYPTLSIDNQCSAKYIIDRIYTIHHRGQTIISKNFESYDIKNLKKYDKEALLGTMMYLQGIFIKSDSRILMGEKMSYAYNKFCYIQENLNNILLIDLKKKKVVSETFDFVLMRDLHENGGHSYVTISTGDELNPNIYR